MANLAPIRFIQSHLWFSCLHHHWNLFSPAPLQMPHSLFTAAYSSHDQIPSISWYTVLYGQIEYDIEWGSQPLHRIVCGWQNGCAVKHQSASVLTELYHLHAQTHERPCSYKYARTARAHTHTDMEKIDHWMGCYSIILCFAAEQSALKLSIYMHMHCCYLEICFE